MFSFGKNTKLINDSTLLMLCYIYLCSWDYLTMPKKSSWATKYLLNPSFRGGGKACTVFISQLNQISAFKTIAFTKKKIVLLLNHQFVFKFQFLHHTISPILANKNTFGTGCALVWFGNFDNKVLTE